MIIDFHTHTFPDRLAPKAVGKLMESADIVSYSDGTNGGLLRSMEKAGIALSVVLPVVTNPAQEPTVNRTAAELNERFAEGFDKIMAAAFAGTEYDGEPVLYSFGGVHPDSPDYKAVLKSLKANGFKGIKLHPVFQGVPFDDIRFKRIVSLAEELGFITLVHAGTDRSYPGDECAAPNHLEGLIKDVAPKRLVLAHMGGIGYPNEAYELVSKYPVYVDTGYTLTIKENELTEAEFLKIAEAAGSDRILFGTDSPWTPQKESAEAVKKLITDEEKQKKLLYKNAVELIKSAG